MIQLRGHHLLCMLGFRGMGYSEEYAYQMALVQEQLRQAPDSLVELVAGPDHLCRHFPDNPDAYHCDDASVHHQDEAVLERLGLHVGNVQPWGEIEAAIVKNFAPGDLGDLCGSCPWLPYGVCEEGVQRVHQGQGMPTLHLVKAPEEVLDSACQFVRGILGSESSGHDWWHAYRVWQLAKTLALKEGGNPLICQLAALLHDIADDKIRVPGAGLDAVTTWLHRHVSVEMSDTIVDIIQTLSYRGGNSTPMTTLEGQIVQDADRLDAIGAIGIARTFAYSGAVGQLMYDPDLPVRTAMTVEEYRHGKSTAVNHFHEKLLKLKDGMNTDSAKQMAHHRHAILVSFLEEFHAEWNGSV